MESFGAILAGGRGTRFGDEPKALATVGGITIIERIREAFVQAGVEPHLITNSPDAFGRTGIPMRGDEIDGRGAVSGVHSALRWARELGRAHALCVACDMPLLRPALLRHLLDLASSTPAEVIVPGSCGPLGYEPLCAVYAVSCCPAIEESLADPGRSLARTIGGLRVETVSLAEVERFGDPDVLFLNVNTRQELGRANHLVARLPSDAAHGIV